MAAVEAEEDYEAKVAGRTRWSAGALSALNPDGANADGSGISANSNTVRVADCHR